MMAVSIYCLLCNNLRLYNYLSTRHWLDIYNLHETGFYQRFLLTKLLLVFEGGFYSRKYGSKSDLKTNDWYILAIYIQNDGKHQLIKKHLQSILLNKDT